MLLQEAIKLRILELADERGYSVNKLAERSGIAPSVLKKTVKPYATTKNTSTEIVARICVGFDSRTGHQTKLLIFFDDALKIRSFFITLFASTTIVPHF